MKLIAFEYGKTEISEQMAFKDGNSEIKLPISLMFFLVETGNKKILLDVGCDTMPGFPLFEFKKPVEVLEEYGVKSSEITDVLLTHSHHDHIDCLQYYPQAEVYLHKDEVELADRYLNQITKLHTFEDSVNISDAILMKHIGGHSIGSSVILISSGYGKYVMCGDECYTMKNLIQGKPTNSTYCLEKSIGFINEYRKKCYIPVLFHDPDIVNKVGFKVMFDEVDNYGF